MRMVARYIVPLIRIQHTIYLRKWWNPSLNVTLNLLPNARPSVHVSFFWLTMDAVALPAKRPTPEGT